MNSLNEPKYSIEALSGDDWEVRYTKQVVRNIAFHKDSLGITTEELARRCNVFLGETDAVKPSTLNGLFAGKRKTLGAAELFMYATALEVPVMSLLVPLSVADEVEVRPRQKLSAARTVRTINGVDPWLYGPPNPLHISFDNAPKFNVASLGPERVMEQYQAESELYGWLKGLMDSLYDGDPSAVIESRIQWVQGALREYKYFTSELVKLAIEPPPLEPMFAWVAQLEPEQFNRSLAESFAVEYEAERTRLGIEAGANGTPA